MKNQEKHRRRDYHDNTYSQSDEMFNNHYNVEYYQQPPKHHRRRHLSFSKESHYKKISYYKQVYVCH